MPSAILSWARIWPGLPEINQEESPTEGALTSVDMVARETFIEFKRNLFSGTVVNPAYINQLDGYLVEAIDKRRGIRTGILTDGKRWILRSIGDAETELLNPPIQVFETAQQGLRLYEWLCDVALTEQAYDIAPTPENLTRYFGDAAFATNQNLATLRWMYDQHRELNTVRVKRRLWGDLLRAALGEVAGTPTELDDLFVRHTYLSAVIGMAVQASFGINIYDLAAQQPSDLLKGERLKAATGLSGIIESDFFAWPTEVSGGDGFIRSLAQMVSRFDWRSAPPDVAANLYQTAIPADERRQLGEYYTPDWLACAMVRELIDDPLNQRVLDPACGSGTFIVEGRGPLPRRRRCVQPGAERGSRPAAQRHRRHRRTSRGGAPGPGSLGYRSPHGHRVRRRLQRCHFCAGVLGRRAATALPVRRPDNRQHDYD